MWWTDLNHHSHLPVSPYSRELILLHERLCAGLMSWDDSNDAAKPAGCRRHAVVHVPCAACRREWGKLFVTAFPGGGDCCAQVSMQGTAHASWLCWEIGHTLVAWNTRDPRRTRSGGVRLGECGEGSGILQVIPEISGTGHLPCAPRASLYRRFLLNIFLIGNWCKEFFIQEKTQSCICWVSL